MYTQREKEFYKKSPFPDIKDQLYRTKISYFDMEQTLTGMCRDLMSRTMDDLKDFCRYKGLTAAYKFDVNVETFIIFIYHEDDDGYNCYNNCPIGTDFSIIDVYYYLHKEDI